tara:strand:- start:445 stop:1110 length:666 start_codon:yes stop_codon:yes gene_type:complete
MPIVSSGTISIHTAAGTDRSITGEFGGTAPHSLSEYYRGGANVPSGATGVPANGTIKLSDFYNAANTFATTNNTNLNADASSPDSNVIARVRLKVSYDSSGNIIVRMSGEDTLDPASNTTVFQITNPASGYTVKRGTINLDSGSDSPAIAGSIGTSATTIPTLSSFVDTQMAIASQGGFDDPGDASANGSGSLIFEKSGDTTFTYSFNFALQADTEGSGGE